MDDLLQQAYYDLIYTLLIQPKEQVPAVLKSQAHLVDEGLLEMLQTTATTLEERNCSEDADFLVGLTQQLQQAGGIDSYLATIAPPSKSQLQAVSKALPGIKPQVSDAEKRSQAEALTQQANQQFQAHKYLPAFQAWQQALQLYRELKDLKQEANCLNKLGTIYQSRGQYQQSMACHQQSYVLSHNGEYRRGEADALNSLGLVCYAVGQYEQAMGTYQQGLKIAQAIQYRICEAHILGNLTSLYAAQGKLDMAIESGQAALEIAKSINIHYAAANFHGNLGLLYGQTGKYQEATVEIQQGLELAQDKNPAWKLPLMGQMGHLRKVRGRFDLATKMLDSYLNQAQKRKAKPTAALALVDLAEVYQAQGNLGAAIEHCQNALTIRQEIQDTHGVVNVLNQLGQLYRAQDATDEAITTFRQVLEQADLATEPWAGYHAGKQLAEMGTEQQHSELVLEGCTVATQALARINPTYLSDDQQTEWQTAFSVLTQQLIQIQIQMQQFEQALETIEWTRYQRQHQMYSRLNLVPDMTKVDDSSEHAAVAELPSPVLNTESKPPASDQATERYQTLRSKFVNYKVLQHQQQSLIARRQAQWLSKLVMLERRSNNPQLLQAETQLLSILETERQKGLAAIQEVDPVLADLLEERSITFAEIQALVKDSVTALLNFYTTPEKTYIFIVTQAGLQLFRTDGSGSPPLQQWLHSWRRQMVSNTTQWREKIPQALKQLVARLQLDQLITQHLAGITSLIIVPDQNLSAIPFAALPLESPASTPQSSTPQYWSDRFGIRVLPHCRVSRSTLSDSTEASSSTSPALNPVGIIEDATGELVLSGFLGAQLARNHQIDPTAYLKFNQPMTAEVYQAAMQQSRTLYADHGMKTCLDSPLDSQIPLTKNSLTLPEILTWRCPKLSRIIFFYNQPAFYQSETINNELDGVSALLQIGTQELILPLWFLDGVATPLLGLILNQVLEKTTELTDDPWVEQMTLPQALNQAQQQLRQLTGQELAEHYQPDIERYLTLVQTNDNQQQINDQRTLLAWLCQQSYPFANPYYWAAWVTYGLGT